MKRSRGCRYWVLASLTLLLVVLATPSPASSPVAASPPSPKRVVGDAWQRATDVGAYHYTTKIAQTTWPLPKLENVGLGSQTEHIYIEGQTDVAARSMQLKLWSEGGSAATGENSLQVRVEQDQAWGSVGASEWKEIKGGASAFTGMFAPGGDPLGYLAAAQDIVKLGAETRAGITFERYTFRLDGPAFAAHMRDLMEAELARKGELPPGLHLDMVRIYLDMQGTGEIWIDSNGLPLRMTTHATFPPDRLEQVEAKITTDFTDWGERPPTSQAKEMASNSPQSWLASLSQLAPGYFSIPGAQSGTQLAIPLSLLLASLSFMLLLVLCRTPRLYATLAVAVIASMVFTPLLQGQQIYAFSQKQAATRTDLEQQQELHQKQEAFKVDLSQKDFDPHRDPLAGREAAIDTTGHAAPSQPIANTVSFEWSACEDLENDTGTDDDTDGLTNLQEDCIGTQSYNSDTDGDGLSDGVEVFELGLNPTLPEGADSDGDSIHDGAEVSGFVDDFGKPWYLNPADPDSNGDGVPDTIECHTQDGLLTDCPDTDLDGTPDVFDFDDDDDGVPDRLDTDRTLVMGEVRLDNGREVVTGLKDQEFLFKLSQLEANRPVYVDFQIRPVNPNHLWYTFNVLDWPSDDREGQVQRVHDTTFGASGQSANGDLRMIPMLEIEIPYQDGHYGHLPVKPGAPAITPTMPIADWLDTAQMDMFGISVRHKDKKGTLLAYVPLVLVQDENGGRVAFSARMFYRPNSSLPKEDQKARLVWVLQAITDSCTPTPGNYTPPPDKDKREAWCEDAAHWAQNPPSIVHTYYDDWYLTGLSVREDHGLQVGVVFEDPDYVISQGYNPDTYYEDNLWQLARGLDKSFLAGRDQDGDGVRDMTLAELERRFDKDLNGSTTDEERWGIEQEAFRVITSSFPHQGYIGYVPMTITEQILADYFVDNSRPKIQNPTLLFAREEKSRTASLEDLADSAKIQAGILRTNELFGYMSTGYPLVTMAGMSWAPFRYAGAGVWEAYPRDEYLAHLQAILRHRFETDQELGFDPQVVEGALMVSVSFYITLLAGANGAVELGGIANPLANAESDRDIIRISYSIAKGASSAAKAIAKEVLSQLSESGRWTSLGKKLMDSKAFIRAFSEGGAEESIKLFKDLGKEKGGITGKIAKIWKGSVKGKAGLIAGAVVAVGLLATATTLYVGNISQEIIDYTIRGVLIAVNIYLIIDAALTIHKLGWSMAKSLALTISRASQAAAIVGVIITAVASVGVFIYEMVSGDVGFMSLEFNQAFATMVATIIVAAVLAAIGLIPIVGQIIVAIIGLIDGAIATVCMALDADDQGDMSDWGWWVCPGITGWLNRLVEFIIYDQTPVIDLEKEDRMQLANFDVAPADPSKGFVVGNILDFSADVATTLYREIPIGLGITYIWQYADIFIDDSTFRYAFVPTTTITNTPVVTLTAMEDEWNPTDLTPGSGEWDIKRFTTTQPVENTKPITLTQPGLNQEPPLYLVESYAIQAQECFLLPPILPIIPFPVPVCYLRGLWDHLDLYLGDKFKFDVFPATLDEFYTLADRGNRSYALAWDERFPTLADADGDGLRSSAHGGNDPDDVSPDNDADGLPDWYEVQHGLDPMQADGDNDGLEDYWEVFYDTDPYRADSDSDGLADQEEITGWEYVYAFKDQGGVEVPLITRVTSDPNDPDSDGDGISDKLENVYGFNPRVYSTPDVLDITSVIDDQDGVVKPGATIAYTATVENQLRDRYALGLLEVDFPAAVQDESIEPVTYMLMPRQTADLYGQVTLQPDIAQSQRISLTNRAGANIANLRGEAGERILWLHLDEEAGATRFMDASSAGNHGTCQGDTCPAAGEPGQSNQAVHFDGVDDYVELNDPVTTLGQGDFSLAAWVKTSVVSAAIVTKSDDDTIWEPGEKSLYLDASGRPTFVGWGCDYIAGTTPVNDGQWHHVAVVWNWDGSGSGGVARMYVDGNDVTDAVATDFAAHYGDQGSLKIGRPNYGEAPNYFSGYIDEVEVYPHALRSDQVAALFNSSFVFEATINQEFYGTAGGGVSFNNPPDLSTGEFSQEIWIIPRQSDTLLRGVLGHTFMNDRLYNELLTEVPAVASYPSIFVRGEGPGQYAGLEVGFIAGMPYKYSIPSVLTRNAWNQVIVTYGDSGYHVYVNGQEKGAKTFGAGVKPAYAPMLDVGSATHCFVVTDQNLHCVYEQSGEYGTDDEYYGKFGYDMTWYHTGVDENETFTHTWSYVCCTLCTLEVWEADGSYDRVMDPDDDLIGSISFSRSSPSMVMNGTPFEGNDAKVTLDLEQINPSQPFIGRVGRVAIYKRVLSKAEVQDLYLAAARALEIRFDEAPGRETFKDYSGNDLVGVCSGSACPDSGLPGRANQAARFDGVDDYVDVPLDVPETEYTLSLWFKTSCADCGIFSVDAGTLGSNGNDRHVYLSSGKLCARVWNNETICSPDINFADGQWHHLAHVIGESIYGQKIYVDGAEMASGSKAVSDFNWQDGLNIGFSNDAANGYFNGLLDHVMIVKKALSAAEVMTLMKDVPSINLHLDEPLHVPGTELTTTVFANVANPAISAGCVLSPTAEDCGCPKAGLKAWMRQGVVFDGSQYGSGAAQCIAMPSASTPDNFTVGGWFRPTQRRWIGDQQLIRKTGSYELSILEGSMNVKFDVTQHGRSIASPQAINSIVSSGTLLLNQWNHVVATYGDGKQTLYINGSLDKELPLSSPASNANPINIGKQFVGMADEVFVYDTALNERAVKDLYQYQSAWYDTAFSHDITIDADDPTVRLDHPGEFIPLQPGYVMAAAAHDPTSDIESVEYSLDNGASWKPTQRDRAIWTFAITPTAEGPLTILVRAADSVNHTAQNSRTVTIDGSAPQISLASSLTQAILEAQTSLRLDGVATDTASGVASVYVTLFDANNAPVGGTQAAHLLPVSSTQVEWWVDYPFPYPPNGQYTLQLKAVDNVGNELSSAPLRRADQTTMPPYALRTAQYSLRLDGTAPFADVTDIGPNRYVISGTALLPTITGTVIEAPYPTGQVLHLHLEETNGATRYYDASRAHLVGDCSGSACPSGAVGHYGQAASFDGGDVINLGAGHRIGDLTQNLSVMAWINPSTTTGLQNIISADSTNSNNGFGLSLNGVGLRFNAYGVHAFNTTSVTLTAGQWTHVAAVVNDTAGTAVTFYVNGIAQQTLTHTLPINANNDDDILIGQSLNGLLDEVVIYDRALTSAQLQAIANPGASGVASVEIGFLHAMDRNTPGSLSWQPVTLAQPGAAFSTWSYTLPPNLEGPHQVYLRTTDSLSHTRVLSNVWQGEIDTQAPRAILTHIAPRFPGDRDIYKCWSEDYNLTSQAYQCPLSTVQAYYQDAEWYTFLFPQAKLWRYESPATSVSDANAADTLTTCDCFGACTTITRTTQSLNWPLGVVIFTPTHQSVFTTLDPVQIGGHAYAQAKLGNLTLMANSQVIDTINWGGSTSSTPWTATFTPIADGAYTLLATIYDTTNQPTTSDAPIDGLPGLVTTIYVDTAAPEINITTDSVTRANFENGYVHLTGQVNESAGITRLQARLNDGEWQTLPHTFQAGWQPWSADLYSGSTQPPSGEPYTLTARVTDVAGNTVETSRSVWADAAPPAAFDLTLSYTNSLGVKQSIRPGTTIYDVPSPTLLVTWTASSDGSGLAPYQVRWIEYLTQTQREVRNWQVAAPRSDSLAAGEAQKLAVEITARDVYSNQTVMTLGPIYVDYQETPVYVGALPPTYHGWQQPPCNLLGADTRVADSALPNASLRDTQNLYAAWNTSASLSTGQDGLRMAWTGANWNSHGDLFIYLDTQAGGSVKAYNPYGVVSDTLFMPAYRVNTSTIRMAADYLIWVQNSSTATLMQWDAGSSQWQNAAGLQYVFAAPVTDLFVPFSALGITTPTTTSLALVAFATEENALRVWAAMPPDNPVNSTRVVNTAWEQGRPFALTHRYAWAALSAGVCPAVGRMAGPHVEVSLAAEPVSLFPGQPANQAPGLSYSLLGNDLPAELADRVIESIGWDTLQQEPCLSFPETLTCTWKIDTQNQVAFDAQAELARLTGTDPMALGPNHRVTYTLHLANQGGAPATGVTMHINTWGPLRLPAGTSYGDYDSITAGPLTLDAGQAYSLTFVAQVDTSRATTATQWGRLDVAVFDDTGFYSGINGRGVYTYPIDWLYADHEIDQSAPDYVEIQEPSGFIGAGLTPVAGIVRDQSPVPSLTLQISSGGLTSTLPVCLDSTPQDGEWLCSIDTGAVQEGDTLSLRPKAADVYGQESDWFDWRTFSVDATPPTVTLDNATLAALSDGWIGPAETAWGGTLFDNRLPHAVEVCDSSSGCASAGAVLLPGQVPTSTCHYEDTNPSPYPQVVYWVPFDVDEDFTITDVDVGLSIWHLRRNSLKVSLIAPSGTGVQLIDSGASASHYDVLLDDAASIFVQNDPTSHNPDAPYYENKRRPYSPLSAFNGEQSLGTWQLVIYDSNFPDPIGIYERARLTLRRDPSLPADVTAVWHYDLPAAGVDGLDQVRSVYGVDDAGNRSSAINLTYTLDTIAPLITVTNVFTDSNVFYLDGQVHDGGGLKTMRLNMLLPDETLQAHTIIPDQDLWAFTGMPQPLEEGVYKLWVEALDYAGNNRTVGPFELAVVIPPPRIIRVRPADGATNVLRNATLAIDFNNPMDTGLVGALITPSTPLAPTWNDAATRLTLGHTVFLSDTAYTVVITGGRNYANELLENAPYTWTFTTGVTIGAEADLSLSKQRVGLGDVDAGGTITYTFSVTNNGPLTRTNAVIIDTFDTAAALAQVSGGNCNWTPGSVTVNCPITSISSTLPARLTLTVVLSQAYEGLLRNTAIVVPNGDVVDPNPNNDEAGPVLANVKGRVLRIYLPVVLKN